VKILIHTDGACRGNPGPGGWGAVLGYGDSVREIRGYHEATTNNRMELTAAVEALSALTRHCTVDLYTDSQYVQKGITIWLEGWKRKNWKTASRKPVKNVDLWMKLDDLASAHDVNWHWVKGHAGDPGNERADTLANFAIYEANIG
jgi:ribonuclease HI